MNPDSQRVFLGALLGAGIASYFWWSHWLWYGSNAHVQVPDVDRGDIPGNQPFRPMESGWRP